MTLLTNDEFLARKATLKGQRFPVLDQGFVELMDAMGSDMDIIEAARTTSQQEAKSEAEDVGLLRYLMRHHHTTPYEMCEIKLRVHVPMDTWRQWIRHRTANVNEYSTRYSRAIDECQQTGPAQWRHQSQSNRQGSSGNFVTDWPEGYTTARAADSRAVVQHTTPSGSMEMAKISGLFGVVTPGDYLADREWRLQQHARSVYEERLAFGVAKEQARKDLPLSNYTESVWKIDAHNLFHFLGLRMDAHAQYEIRQYANVIGEQIVARLWPEAWRAFLDYQLNAMKLTALDILVLNKITNTGLRPPISILEFLRLQHPDWAGLEKCRERDESLAKLQRLGLVAT